MQRYAIIDAAAGKVINVVEYDAAPENPPPGFDAGIIAVQNDTVGPGWTWDSKSLIAPPAPPPVVFPQTVLSQDLMAQFTAADAGKIQMAVTTNPQFWLLWSALQAQKDPMEVGNARFMAGWSALVAVLGADRMTAVAVALGVTVA